MFVDDYHVLSYMNSLVKEDCHMSVVVHYSILTCWCAFLRCLACLREMSMPP